MLKFVETVCVVMEENVSRQVMYFRGVFLFVKGRARVFHVFQLNKLESHMSLHLTAALLEK